MITSKLLSIVFLALIASGCATRTVSLQQQPLNLQTKCKAISRNSSTAYYPCNKQITLTCKPLILTDIQLLPQEYLSSLNCGDSARWVFQTIVTSTDDLPTTHILIKPKQGNLKTNLIVVTNLRTYRINLLSKDEGNIAQSVAYYKPDIGRLRQLESTKIDAQYDLKVPLFQRKPKWTPNQIYNNGTSVFIYIPKIEHYQAPVFFELDQHDHPLIVNYAVNQNCYQISNLFKRAVLIKGIGRDQEKVFINYLGDY